MTDKSKDDIELEIDTETEGGKPVEVDLEAGKEVEAKATPADDAPPPVEDEGIKSLREQLAQARSAREAAEKQAREASEEVSRAKSQVGESQYQVIVSAIEATKREGDQAEADYAKAMEDGRYQDAAKAQRILARVEGRLDQLDGARANMETARKAPPATEGAVRPPAQQPPVDPVEALAGQLSPASASWVRSHPECATDPVVYQEMVAADARARRLGHVPDTPEYFAFIEQRLGFGEPAAAVAPPPARRGVPAAPVSRDVPGSASNARRTITLSPEEQEIAQMNGMTNAEYAKYKADYQAEKAVNA